MIGVAGFILDRRETIRGDGGYIGLANRLAMGRTICIMKNTPPNFAAILCLGISPLISLAGDKPSSIPDDVKDLVRNRVANRYAPSIVIGVMTADGESYYCEGSTRWIDGDPVTPDTVYEIGSITKAFTGTLLADMVTRGEVKLTDPIEKYFPEGKSAPKRGDRDITLAHLAEHSSGLPRLPDNMMFEDPDDPYAAYTPDQMFEFLDGYQLTRDIGKKYEYSNFGMGLLGELLARRAGKSYEALLTERIIEPLNMPSTRITHTDSMKKRLAQGHSGAEAAKRWNIAALAGAGDLDSTARDMLHFAAAFLNADKGPLAEAMKLATTPRRDAGSSNKKIGLGWHIRMHHGKPIIWHNGGTGGFRSFCGYAPDRGMAVAILTNTSMPAVDDIGMHLLEPEIPMDDDWNRTTVKLTDDQLTRLEGRYELTPVFSLDMKAINGFLTVRPTGQPTFTLHAADPLEFFLVEPEAGATFELNDKGKATSLVWHQNGNDQPGPRTGDVPAEKKRERKKIDPAILAKYVGKYELLPQAIFTITLDGDQLYAQLTGQPTFPVYAESETRFYYEVVEAAITFEQDDKDKTTALVLHQGGMDQRATKTE